MSNKALGLSIPNWSMFGAKNISINLFKKDIDGEVLYTTAILFWIDDGVERDEEDELTVTLFTDVVSKDPKQAAFIVAEYVSNLFEKISSYVYVFDDDGSVVEEFDLNEEEYVDEFDEGIEFESLRSEGEVFH